MVITLALAVTLLGLVVILVDDSVWMEIPKKLLNVFSH